jgi:hypothetical protein
MNVQEAHEIRSRVQRLWDNAGLLAPGIYVTTEIEAFGNQGRLTLIVDVPNCGRKESMTARVYRSILMSQADDANLEALVGMLYRDMSMALAKAHNIGVRF